MRAGLILLGFVVTMGTGVAVYLGRSVKETQDRAKATSARIKEDVENNQARRALRRDWDNEHSVLSDNAFAGFKHDSQTIGGVEVSCPRCKEL